MRTSIILRTQGEASAQALFDLFHGYGVAQLKGRGGWYKIIIAGWPGTDYSALVHARQCFPSDRIYCKTVRSLRHGQS